MNKDVISLCYVYTCGFYMRTINYFYYKEIFKKKFLNIRCSG
jgi:hypothetical protein